MTEQVENTQEAQQPKVTVLVNFDGYQVIHVEGNPFVEGRDPDGRLCLLTRERFRNEMFNLFTNHEYVPPQPVPEQETEEQASE